MNNNEFLTVVAYVKCSTYREKVLKGIGNEYITPTHLSEKIGIRTNHISNVLSQLKEKQVIECINEEMRKGRLYTTTALGKMVLNEIT